MLIQHVRFNGKASLFVYLVLQHRFINGRTSSYFDISLVHIQSLLLECSTRTALVSIVAVNSLVEAVSLTSVNSYSRTSSLEGATCFNKPCKHKCSYFGLRTLKKSLSFASKFLTPLFFEENSVVSHRQFFMCV